MLFKMNNILNGSLPWDGSDLGCYDISCIVNAWSIGKSKYYMIYNHQLRGFIYCNIMRSKDAFPCIVEDIKKYFNLSYRTTHMLTIQSGTRMIKCIIYNISFNEDHAIRWETPLNMLDKQHYLRSNKEFILKVQQILIFNEMLSLNALSEFYINIHVENGKYIPAHYGTSSTSLTKTTGEYHTSGINRCIFNRWFANETPEKDVLVNLLQPLIPVNINQDNLPMIISIIRDHIEHIISKHDKYYIWYTQFIIDRISSIILSS